MTSLRKNDRNALVNMAAFVIVIVGLKAASVLVVPFLFALFLSIICLPSLTLLQQKKVPVVLSLALVIIVVISIWMLVIVLLGSALADFTMSIPDYQVRLRRIVGDVWRWLVDLGITVDRAMLDEILDPGRIMKLVSSLLNSLGGLLKNAFLIFLMFVFLSVEALGFPKKLRAISSDWKMAQVSYYTIIKGVNRYLAIKSVTSVVTGVLVFVFLHFQGVDFPILWGMLACILNFIPNIGSLVAAIPPVLLALIQFGPVPALYTSCIFLGINVAIGSVIEPKVMGQGVGLSTLVVLLSLLFWGWVFGPVGMLLSVPLTMALKISFSYQESTSWLAVLLGSNSEIEEGQERVGNSHLYFNDCEAVGMLVISGRISRKFTIWENTYNTDRIQSGDSLVP